MTKLTFLCFFTNKYFFYIKAKLTVPKSLSSTQCYFFDSTHLKGCCFFSSIFQPKGEPQDLDEPFFLFTFCPSFIPSIGFWRYSSKNSNPFLACCGQERTEKTGQKRQKNHCFNMVRLRKISLAESRGSSRFFNNKVVSDFEFGHFLKKFIQCCHL